MNIIIIGCGMVGAALAHTLDEKGHDVNVVDKSSARLDTLSDNFSGFTTTGVPIDQDVLKRAGILTCDALFAVTDEDDMNIMVAQLAKQVYTVPKVFASITDISKGEVFAELGIRIVCPTKLTVADACTALEETTDFGGRINLGNTMVNFIGMEVPEQLIGKTPSDIKYESGEVLFGVQRSGAGIILYNGRSITFAEGDMLIFAKKG